MGYKKQRIILIIILLFTSCTISDATKQEIFNPILDVDTNLRKTDFFVQKDNSDDEDEDKKKLSFINNNTIPQFSNIIIPPRPNSIGNGQLISLSITDKTPLKDVLIELARLTDIDIQLDSAINANVILKVTDKPIEVVINNLCEIANLKYKYENGILKIEKDEIILKDYDVDILSDSELWTSIKEGIDNILTIEVAKVNSKLKKEANDQYLVELDEYNKFNENKDPLDNTTKTTPEEKTTEDIVFSSSLNKLGGLISVYANEKSQILVEKYINRAKRNYGAQVLIEAKVIEIQLKDEFKAGINWSYTLDKLKINNSIKITDGLISSSSTEGLSAIIDAVQIFGNMRTLSSPRISTLNNQKAQLDFIQKLVYFSIENSFTTTTNSNGVQVDVQNSTKQEEEEGVKLEITPTINLNTQEITLTVKPELRVRTKDVTDPANPKNEVPVIQTRSLTTSLKLNSGNVMIIGGLITESSNNSVNGVPVLQNIPGFGWLFKYKSKKREVVETVIFIKATIIDQENPLKKSDGEFYEKFSTERENYLENNF